MIALGRQLTLLLCVWWCVACASNPPVAPTPLPSPVPTASPVPSPLPTATRVAASPTVSADTGPLVVRIIHADANTPQPLIDIITQTAVLQQIDIIYDVHSPDGTYALAAIPDKAPPVDVWIGTEYDLQQLARLGVVAQTAPALAVPHYAYIDDALQRNATLAAMPIALRNYLVSIGNDEYLDALPDTTAQVLGIGGMIQGRVRYKMAYPWPEGRWFAMMLDQLGAQNVLTQTNSVLPSDMLLTALTSLDEMRVLGPREATTYVEATSDFINWYVPYTIDGDAAIRRYEKYQENLPLIYAPPPTYSASGQRMMPAVDVVYAIIPQSVSAARRARVESFMAALQQPPAQIALFTAMRWIPINQDVMNTGELTASPLFVALMPFIPTLTTQAYDDTTICRWDAYEQVLPLVLLNDIKLQAGVDAINNALQACIINP